jgi:hypothetical protein
MDTTNSVGSAEPIENTTGGVLHRLKVEGMHCRSCENLVIETLGKQPGVSAA